MQAPSFMEEEEAMAMEVDGEPIGDSVFDFLVEDNRDHGGVHLMLGGIFPLPYPLKQFQVEMQRNEVVHSEASNGDSLPNPRGRVRSGC